MGSGFELATAETFVRKAQTSAAAGVSLSKQTMHRAHDPNSAFGPGPSGGTGHLGRETLRRKYARRFLYTPFAVGAALIWAALLGVKRKIADLLRESGTPGKARQTYCIVVPGTPFRHQYVEISNNPPLGKNHPAAVQL